MTRRSHDWLKKDHIKVMPWPSQSADLTPVKKKQSGESGNHELYPRHLNNLKLWERKRSRIHPEMQADLVRDQIILPLLWLGINVTYFTQYHPCTHVTFQLCICSWYLVDIPTPFNDTKPFNCYSTKAQSECNRTIHFLLTIAQFCVLKYKQVKQHVSLSAVLHLVS